MSPPTDFAGLAPFLAKFPNLAVQWTDRLEFYRFQSLHDGKINFLTPRGTQITIPVDVGRWSFFPDRFERDVFSRREKYFYELPKPTPETEWEAILSSTLAR